MPQTIWHSFLAQFSLLIQMVSSVILFLLHTKIKYLGDPDWLLKIFNQLAVGFVLNTVRPRQKALQNNWLPGWKLRNIQIAGGVFDKNQMLGHIAKIK